MTWGWRGAEAFGHLAAHPCMYDVRFASRLFRVPGKGGWTFAPVPPECAPPVTHGWGRTPVVAVVNGYEWQTSVWRERSGRVLLAIPKAARGAKGDGDEVEVQLRFDVG